MSVQSLEKVVVNTDIGTAVSLLLENRHPIEQERRSSVRVPYSCCALLHCEGLRISIPAYVHDLSQDGIGFIHGTRIELGNMTACLQAGRDRMLTLKILTHWCRDFGQGWYRSGAEITELSYDRDDFVN
jgi:hypothetical protein